jgi:2,4-diaminopentanoate dehydrogenase
LTYRVVQWATGAIGKTCLRAVLDHPDMSLAGVYVYSGRKAGQDAGTIARYPETGIIATRDSGEILALDADVVIHTARLQLPYGKHDDDICALLRSGKNVISTAGHHYPTADRLARFSEAALAGGATLYGTGMNPGYVLERLVLGLTGVCTDVRRIEVVELLNAASMPDPDFVFNVMGMGSDPAALDLRGGALAGLYGELYGEAIAFTCDRMNVSLDEIVPDHRVVAAERDLSVGAGVIKAGTVAATEWRWHALSAGERFLTLSVIWTMDPSLADYAGRHHWTVEIEGRPDLHLSLDMSDPPGTGLRTKAGQYVTAGAVINAIPAVVAAPPGVFAPPVFAPFTRTQAALTHHSPH